MDFICLRSCLFSVLLAAWLSVAGGFENPVRRLSSVILRPPDPVPRGSSNDAAKIELSASGGVGTLVRGELAPPSVRPSAQPGYLSLLANNWKMPAATENIIAKIEQAAPKAADAPLTLAAKPEADESTSADPDATEESNATAAPATEAPGLIPHFDAGQYGITQGEISGDIRAGLANLTTNFTHTWGDQSHNVLGLPSYAAVLIGGTVAAIIVICANVIGGRLATPLPFFATEEQKLKHQLEQTKYKVSLLQKAVAAKREQEIKEAELEAMRQRGEEVVPEKGPTHDELVGEMLYRTQEVQTQAIGAVNDSIKQAAPLLARASYVQTVFTESMKGVTERVSDLAVREASNIYAQVKEAVGSEDGADLVANTVSSTGAYGGLDIQNWFRVDDENDLDPPPFALLLGGMFAPAQIKATQGQCNSQMVWNSIILATCTACAVIDGHHECPDKFVWAWQYGMLTLNALDILCCSFISSRCATALGTLSDDQDRIGRIKKTGNSVWDAYIMMQANSGQFFKAYFAYQNIVDSWIYTFQKLMCIVSLVWGFLGIYVTCMNIVQDTLACDAKVVLWFMHTYSWFFLMFLSWTLISLAIWMLQKLSGYTFVTAPLMEKAKFADEEVPFRLPLFQTIARSFLLRDASTMLHIKVRQVEKDVYNLEQEVEENKRKLDQRKSFLSQLEVRREASLSAEKKLIEVHKEKIRESGELPVGDFAQADAGAGSSGVSSPYVFGNAGAAGASRSSASAGSASAGSASAPFFEGAGAADLLAQASAAASSVQEQGLAATMLQAQDAASSAAQSMQTYAAESGLTQNASDALSSVQESAADVATRAQQLADEHGVTQGASNAVARAQEALDQHSSMQDAPGGSSSATAVVAGVEPTATGAPAVPEAEAQPSESSAEARMGVDEAF